MNSLSGLGAWGSNLLGQASESLGQISDSLAPSAALAAEKLRSGVKEVKKSMKENLGSSLSGFSGGATHHIQDAKGGPSRDVTEVAFLAEGAFGAVLKVTCSRSGQTFALKKIACAENTHVASSFDSAEREAKILSQLPTHPNIIQCFGFAIDKGSKGSVKLLLELCSGGHLLDYQDSKGGNLSAREMMEPFVQITEAVRFLHSQKPPIQHRDLKIENVLKGNDGQWKLCDFGSCSSRCVPAEQLSKKDVNALQDEIDKTVTMLYRPPEMVDVTLNFHEGYEINEKVDIWMLGCILFTLAFYQHPFQDSATVMAIWNARFFIPMDHAMARSQKLCALIQWLLSANPKDRPSAEGLLQACRAIGKAEYSEFLASMPKSVGHKLQEMERKYGNQMRQPAPVAPEFDFNAAAAAAARASAGNSSSSRSNGRSRAADAEFDVRFALSPEAHDGRRPSGGYGGASRAATNGSAGAKTPSPQEDLLSIGHPGLNHSPTAPAMEDLLGFDDPAALCRAKSAPAVSAQPAGGTDLLAFADFDSAPSQQAASMAPSQGNARPAPAPQSGFNACDFGDFSSAPPSSNDFANFATFAPPPGAPATAHSAPPPQQGAQANLLDLI
eukprot:TRINITY_DN106577_c0_g1_i1.p1 TRINITY_DN106577_c0_g1~~TRINITY_DN106577_c0_g1_i1.p1  ORF type:complete len:652 (+),score=155.57 TRINITY_DN106577_c0_g1_i1:118-1956(+)